MRREIGFIFDASFETLDEAELDREASREELFQAETATSTPSSGKVVSQYAATPPLLTSTGERVLFRKMNYVRYRANAVRSTLDPSTPDSEQVEYIERMLDEADRIRDRIVASNLRLVCSIARRFATERLSFDELVSEGNFILLKAVDKFDFSRGFRFSTYLTHAVQRHYYRYIQTTHRRYMMESPTSANILRDVVPTEERSCEDAPPEPRRVKRLISKMCDQLDDRELRIVTERTGLNASGQSRTLQSLSEELGICKERVRQLYHKALRKLRTVALDLGFDGVA